MGEQGNLVPKFTQGALEGAEKMDSHNNHSASRLSRTTQKPGMKSMQKRHRELEWQAIGKSKNSAQYDAGLKGKGEKMQIKNEENHAD